MSFMSSDRTSVGLTLLGFGMLISMCNLPPVYDTKRAQDLSTKLESVKPEPSVNRNDWARSTLDKIGLADSFVGFEVDLKFATNAQGTGIQVYNSGRYLGTVDLDRVQNYLDSRNKR